MPIVSGGGGGGTAFNGGTITGKLAVHPTSTSGTDLEVVAPTSAGGDTVDFKQTDTGARFRLTSQGTWVLLDANGTTLLNTNAFTDVLLLGFGGIVSLNSDGFLTVSDPGYAPSDGSIPTGWCSIYFDATNGAPKLKLKGKQADGTVVTASIALA